MPTPDLADRAEYAELPLPMVALHEARAFIGLEEQGDNRGPAVEFFQMHARIPVGSPWCAAFTNGCIHTACAKQNAPSPLERLRRQGLVQDVVDWAESGGRVISADEVEPGDLFALYFGPPKDRYAHIGFVYDIPRGQPRFSTVEGNSNEGGSREGYKVLSRVRRVTDGTLFIRWTED